MDKKITYEQFKALKNEILEYKRELMDGLSDLEDNISRFRDAMDELDGSDDWANTALNRMIALGIVAGKRFKIKGEEYEIMGYTDSLCLVCKRLSDGEIIRGGHVNRFGDHNLDLFEPIPVELKSEWQCPEAKYLRHEYEITDADGLSVGITTTSYVLANAISALPVMRRILSDVLINWDRLQDTNIREAIIGALEMCDGKRDTIPPHEKKED